MPAVRRSYSWSPSPSPSTTPTAHDPPSNSEDTSCEVPYTRRRATDAQLKTLRAIFEAKPYPSREERNHLALEIGMDYKAITVWFQNKRQSEKRKAWTKNSRAKKREEARQAVDVAKPPPLTSALSLDRIATLSERPSIDPSAHDYPASTSTRPPPSPRRESMRMQPSTPTARSELWRHMLSSPPEPPSPPSADRRRLSLVPTKGRPMKSLEWACAKAREGRRYVRGKENSARWDRGRNAPAVGSDVDELDSDSDTETEADEALTPSLSFSSVQSDTQDEDVRDKRHVKSLRTGSESKEDVDAAMLLLGLFKGQ
ncbi:homeobox-domain-containing protein [Artomyces pyxidatus]|uniref:Homeobox-domain-containing protein n=1 Tax=Artomyces pyxidatus TaxID=48021 RepID=A0ACB8TI60_9AGAM|nr:homeobox-domain-containing protein [Artomyces pyxidatus]